MMVTWCDWIALILFAQFWGKNGQKSHTECTKIQLIQSITFCMIFFDIMVSIRPSFARGISHFTDKGKHGRSMISHKFYSIRNMITSWTVYSHTFIDTIECGTSVSSVLTICIYINDVHAANSDLTKYLMYYWHWVIARIHSNYKILFKEYVQRY